jgi:hypothetical protein
MKNRVLLKEIPSGKFHSAIFTTYSINLYYLEQQVLSLLGSKGIHYISVLADSQMLSKQLENYCAFSQTKKRNYSLHGIQSKGAFHPKLIFLIGSNSMLLLLGSGNLTTTGHGKNLETWNSIYVDSNNDSKIGFLYQVWEYLNEIQFDLGESVQNKLNSIRENSELLSNIDSSKVKTSYQIENGFEISYLTSNTKNSIFSQLIGHLITEDIQRIYILSPYYDSKGTFINLLYEKFHPNEINVILQKKFGSAPYNMKDHPAIHYYDWEEVPTEKFKQDYFHSKNIIFETKHNSYLLSGSANASIAAFGYLNKKAINDEACILYKSDYHDFKDVIGFRLQEKVNLDSYSNNVSSIEGESKNHLHNVFIKTAEKNFNDLFLIISANKEVGNTKLVLVGTNNQNYLINKIRIKQGIHTYKFEYPHGEDYIYLKVYSSKSNQISNKQFIVDINAFEGTNPSYRNRELNKIKNQIGNGGFDTLRIIQYLNNISKQKVPKALMTQKSTEKKKENKIIDDKSDLIYLTYEEIQKKANEIDNSKNVNIYTEYRSIRIWDSIFSYLKENREKEIQDRIDEEETENLNTSSGRPQSNKKKDVSKISKTSYADKNKKIKDFFDGYFSILNLKIENCNSKFPTIIDFSMYLIVLEILLHLVSQKIKIENQNEEKPLLKLMKSNNNDNWSNYLLKTIGLFCLWINNKQEKEKINHQVLSEKISDYYEMSFKTTLVSLIIFERINFKYNQTLAKQWIKLSLLNSNIAFNKQESNFLNTDDFIEFVPQKLRTEFGEESLIEKIDEFKNLLKDHIDKKPKLSKETFFHHPTDGISSIEKIIINNTTNDKFYKLINTGYKWNEKLNNYWNGKAYSIKEKKWFTCS